MNESINQNDKWLEKIKFFVCRIADVHFTGTWSRKELDTEHCEIAVKAGQPY